MFAAEDGGDHTKRGLVVALHELAEGGFVTGLGAGDEFGVGGRLGGGGAGRVGRLWVGEQALDFVGVTRQPFGPRVLEFVDKFSKGGALGVSAGFFGGVGRAP